MVDVPLKKHSSNSTLFKIVLLYSNVILINTKMEQEPLDFKDNNHLQHEKVAQAAELAVCLGIRPLGFCDGSVEMKNFAQTIFEMTQTVPANKKIDPKSYLPGRNAVTSAVRETSDSLRHKFITDRRNGLLRFGGAVTVDGVHLNVQGKHFYDFKLHFLEVKDKGPFSGVQFEIPNETLLLLEEPEQPNANNIRLAFTML